MTFFSPQKSVLQSGELCWVNKMRSVLFLPQCLVHPIISELSYNLPVATFSVFIDHLSIYSSRSHQIQSFLRDVCFSLHIHFSWGETGVNVLADQIIVSYSGSRRHLRSYQNDMSPQKTLTETIAYAPCKKICPLNRQNNQKSPQDPSHNVMSYQKRDKHK